MLSPALIDRVLEGLAAHDAVTPALKVTDTVKRVAGGTVEATLEREGLYTVQTPQGFRFETLLTAHQRLKGRSLPDDATVIEQSGGRVAIVAGDPFNRKITTNEDLDHMQMLQNHHSDIRVGQGYDVHPLMPHDGDTPASHQHIKLCGVRIPFSHRLVGHSDADVGLHALVDAILGAIGDGDIGMHFPPHDPKWQGADSERFLLHAYERAVSRGGSLVHLDVTLICEAPKIAPYREQMRTHIAQLLKLAPDRVSVKATTTEKLGFTGRGEGIAALAVATVRMARGR